MHTSGDVVTVPKRFDNHSRPVPSPMVVYDGTLALGEIEDYGPNDIRAYIGIGDERKAIGTYATRRDAMRAVSSAAATQRRLTEPVPWASGLPG